jgi:betaine-aldehyde dehydrogenase
MDAKGLAGEMSAPTGNDVALLWIGGKWVDTPDHRESIDPATGEVIGHYAMGRAEDAERAIAIAKQTFNTTAWRDDRPLRARVLNSMADLFEARSDDFVEIIALENGKIKPEARFETDFSAPTLRFNAALALTDMGRTSSPEHGQLDLVLRQPVGVAGVIAPWNSPLALVLRSLAPALAAGCTAVVSLPHQTAQTNYLFAQVLAQVPELPLGVISVLTGGFDTGDALVKSPDVPTISFTGSSKTGRVISANAAANLKRVGLELGGKHPNVVFDDADLDLAIPTIVSSLTVFAGQFCMTGSRLLVQSGIADEVRNRVASRLENLKVGPAADPASEMGPVIDKPNVARIDKMVEDAIAAGAKVIVRGGPVTEGPLAAGAFYRPALLEVTDSSLPIVQQEVFGPVLTMLTFDTEEQAIELANDSEYGLSGSIFSSDVDLPMRVAMQLDIGTVWVNDWAHLHDQFEEGGFKSSGVGRMRGLAVIDDFIEYKHISTSPMKS